MGERFVGSWLASDDIGPTRRIGLLVCTVSITGNALARYSHVSHPSPVQSIIS